MTSPASTTIDTASPIQFTQPSALNPAPAPPFNAPMSFMPGTNPCTITFNNQIYVLFNGSASDGVWYTVSADGVNWASVDRAPGLTIAPGASPAAVIVPGIDRLFLYANQNPGVSFVTTTDFVNWTAPQPVPNIGIQDNTNPCPISFNGTVFTFYNGNGFNGIWAVPMSESNAAFGTSFQITTASDQSSFLDILAGTSPCAAVFGGQLYLFYISAGSSGLATNTTTASTPQSTCQVFVTVFSTGSNTWSKPQQVGTATSAGSPAAIVAGPTPSSVALYLFWPTPPTLTVAYTFDGETWEPSATLPVNQINTGTSPSTTRLGTTPYVFWTGLNGASTGTGLGAVFSAFEPIIPE